MNSIAFTQNDIVFQLQLQSKPWKLLYTITDKTQVSFRQFAWADFHAHLLASLTLISMKKKYSAIASNPQHSVTFLGIHLRHSTYKREKCTFINASIRVINIILKIIRDKMDPDKSAVFAYDGVPGSKGYTFNGLKFREIFV